MRLGSHSADNPAATSGHAGSRLSPSWAVQRPVGPGAGSPRLTVGNPTWPSPTSACPPPHRRGSGGRPADPPRPPAHGGVASRRGRQGVGVRYQAAFLQRHRHHVVGVRAHAAHGASRCLPRPRPTSRNTHGNPGTPAHRSALREAVTPTRHNQTRTTVSARHNDTNRSG